MMISAATPSGTNSHRAKHADHERGTQSISSPFDYSKEARGLLSALGIEPQKRPRNRTSWADRTLSGLQNSHSSTRDLWRRSSGDWRSWDKRSGWRGKGKGKGGEDAEGPVTWTEWLAKTPLSPKLQKDIARLQEDKVDYMPGLTSDQKKDRLSRMSYKDFLLNYVKVDPGVIPYYQKRTHGLYGVGIDAVGALEVWPGYPGFDGMNIEPGAHPRLSFTALGRHVPRTGGPYNYHFPDGNASVARSLARSLFPGIAPGTTAESIVAAKFDYSKLDSSGNQIRMRLSSTLLRARHVGNPATAKQVELVYGREKQLYSVRAKSVILACWNGMIPYVCEDLPASQKEALKYGVKVPLCYIAVGLRNWRAFQKMGIRGASAPGMYTSGINLESPTRIGDYLPEVKSPDDPVLARTGRDPNKPGLSARDQQRAGQAELLTTPFAPSERNIRDQMTRILAPGGFDPAKDIEAITVDRLPHGYAYEYNYLWDPEWKPGEAPCELGRKQFGRISIANADAAAAAYTDQAINQAYRAVQEQLALKA